MTDPSGDPDNRRRWIPSEGIRVNPGRMNPRFGEDAILPFVDIPDWLTPAFRSELDAYEIVYSVQEGILEPDVVELADGMRMNGLDRFSFPQLEPLTIQRFVDSTLEKAWHGRVNDRGVFVNPMMEMSLALEMFTEALRILETHRGGIHVRLRAALEFFLAIDRDQLPGGEARTLFDHVGVPRSGLPPEDAPPCLLEQLSEMTETQAQGLAAQIQKVADYIEYRLRTG